MAWFKLIRLCNDGMAMASVFLGYFSARAFFEPVVSLPLAAAGLSAFLMAAYGNLLNDLFDVNIDRINRPERPLVSGAVNIRSAGLFSGALLLAGFWTARLVSPAFLAAAFGIAVLLWLYNAFLKNTLLFGNLAVAFLTGLTLLWGAFLAEHWQAALIPAVFAFFINLAREIIKDAEDMKGDRAAGSQTLALRYGAGFASRIAAVLLFVLVVATFVPYLLGWYGKYYMILAGLGVDIPLIFLCQKLSRRYPEQAFLKKASAVLKWVMLAGILAVLAGRRY